MKINTIGQLFNETGYFASIMDFDGTDLAPKADENGVPKTDSKGNLLYSIRGMTLVQTTKAGKPQKIDVYLSLREPQSLNAFQRYGFDPKDRVEVSAYTIDGKQLVTVVGTKLIPAEQLQASKEG